MIAIAAVSKNRVIGNNGALPWHLPADLRFFKRTTTGHTVVMGRKTFESIGHPLPNRTNVVLSREESKWPAPDGVVLIHHASQIPSAAVPGTKVFLIGGASLYAALLPSCDELLLTNIHREVAGDTYFPEFTNLFTPAEILESGDGYEIRRYLRSKN